MLTKPLLIATIATGLSVAAFSPQVSADPIGGAIVGGAIGAAVGGPPGAAFGAILGTAIGTDVYYNGPHYAYSPAPYYGERYYASPPAAYYEPAPVYYAPRVAPVYYAPRVVYARPPSVYGQRRHNNDRPRHYDYAGRYERADYSRYR